MNLTVRQKQLLTLNVISLSLLILFNIFFQKLDAVLVYFYFIPFICFALLTTTTNQEVFNVKKEWRIPLVGLLILSAKFVVNGWQIVLTNMGLQSHLYSIIISLIIFSLYIYFYFRNIKRHSVKR